MIATMMKIIRQIEQIQQRQQRKQKQQQHLSNPQLDLRVECRLL